MPDYAKPSSEYFGIELEHKYANEAGRKAHVLAWEEHSDAEIVQHMRADHHHTAAEDRVRGDHVWQHLVSEGRSKSRG